MSRRFVTVSFRCGGRAYTYHAGDEPVAVGDVVKLPGRQAEGWTRGIVEAVDVPEPTFETRPVLGIIETAAERAARKESPQE